MSQILDFEWYCANVLKIQTKTGGVQPFRLRKVQKRFIAHLKEDFRDGIVRSLSLKPRQAGWSTLIAGLNTHRTVTRFAHKGLVMADKFARTSAVHSIYTKYIENIPTKIRPMLATMNTEEVLFDNPNKELRISSPGLSSGFLTETAQDPNAGKSSARQWAHLSEYAFYPRAMEIDQSVQNSIPLARGTFIFKESTANGMGGDGESFYNQWMAAEAGEYLYKPFFVPWYEVDDYQIAPNPNFILTSEEKDIILRCPEITNANLAWRRMKIREIAVDGDSGLTPEELFKQDFPLYPEEAFLSSGRPVFDQQRLKSHIDLVKRNPPEHKSVKATRKYVSQYIKDLVTYEYPKEGEKYSMGVDVAEGLEIGDASDIRILNSRHIEVCRFHSHLPPDHLGHVVVELATIYNKAIVVPEVNNMGHTTLTTIKDLGYLRVYETEVIDEIDSFKTTKKLGWRTTRKSKNQMLNRFISEYRDGECSVRDVDLLREMMRITRGDSGEVELNGKDRTVAYALALMGFDQIFEAATVVDPKKKKRLQFETKDLFGLAIKGKL